MEKEKAEKDLRSLKEELKNFNAMADQRINNEMTLIFREEEEKHEREMRDIQSKVFQEEEEVDRLNRKLQELMQKIKNVDKDSKAKIMQRKNENLKLKEECGILEMTLNKIVVNINTENKELERCKENLDQKFIDLDEIKEKRVATESRYSDEIDNINLGHEEAAKELEDALRHFKEEE